MNKQLLLPIILLSLPFIAYGTTDTGGQTNSDQQGQTTTIVKKIYKHPPSAKPKAQEYYINSDMERYFQADELKQLLAGENDFYALFRDDMTGRPRGVALLIPDWALGATNNRGIEGLRTTLPDYGWVTLSMTVPGPQESVTISKPPTPNQSGEEQSGEQQADQSSEVATSKTPAIIPYQKPKPIRLIDEAFFDQYELQIKMRLQALISEAQNYQGYFIIIAQGSSAAAVASIYTKEELEEPEALIFISAALPDAKLIAKMNQDITTTPIPTLDIYPATSYPYVLKNVKLRRKLAKKNFKISYRQQRLFADISYHNQNRRLLKSVYGWLSSLGL